MKRYQLLVEYDGTHFCGWQSQPNGQAIQDIIEQALFDFCGEKIRLYVAGRTDKGVHALAQSVHFDINKETDTKQIRDGLNFHLRPHPIIVIKARQVENDFHARFCATKRHYIYRMICGRAPLALEHHRAWHLPKALSLEHMQEGAKLFLGTHDFTTFRSSHCQATSPIKTIETFNVVLAPYMVRQKNGFETSNGFEQEESFGWGKRIDIYVSAKSFLQHQIRSCVGALKLLGEGKWHKTDLHQALIAKNRAQCPPLAPACGLYLVKVDYA